jgi:hypothetical protein
MREAGLAPPGRHPASTLVQQLLLPDPREPSTFYITQQLLPTPRLGVLQQLSMCRYVYLVAPASTREQLMSKQFNARFHTSQSFLSPHTTTQNTDDCLPSYIFLTVKHTSDYLRSLRPDTHHAVTTLFYGYVGHRQQPC